MIDANLACLGNNPKWNYNNKFDLLVNRCTEITFRLFQEDIADDDWLAEGETFRAQFSEMREQRTDLYIFSI